MGTDAQKAGFKAVSELVKSWRTGDYVHHVRHLADKGTAGHDFLVIFSLPQPTKPVPEQVAHATFTVRMPEAGDEEAAPKISYTVEMQHQRLDGSLPIRKVRGFSPLHLSPLQLLTIKVFELVLCP